MYDIFCISKGKSKRFLELQKKFPLIKLLNYENNTGELILSAQRKSLTKFFWLIADGFSLENDFNFKYELPEWDKKYIHVFKSYAGKFEGIYLVPKNYHITKKEADYCFFINKKEIDIVASRYYPYEDYVIYEPEDFFKAQNDADTSMFYAINKDYKFDKDTDFFVPEWDQKYVHVFKNYNGDYEGAVLIPKTYSITKKEAEYSFFINKKEIDKVVCKLCFDIVFISYNEPNANENFKKLKERFPDALRVHGVDGIHQAHIEAAKLVKTSMFWVVDGDAVITDDFDFYIHVPKWDRDAVHVFRSKNPINELTYGYGGVKLLPTSLVLDMDVNSVDMTTSISKKFISTDRVSNITAFDTDAFNTWKSAFRECVKLSSKSISGQIDDETKQRLDIWCTVGSDKPFGDFAIRGAIAGREFGTTYAEDKEMLKKINDWEWLENEFRQ